MYIRQVHYFLYKIKEFILKDFQADWFALTVHVPLYRFTYNGK